jgi:hypothetical protein
MALVPLRITMFLATPVALNHPWLHFDGLIAHLRHLVILGREYYCLPTKQAVTVRPPKKLRWRWRGGIIEERDGIACASVSEFGPDPRMQTLQYFKRFELAGAPQSLRSLYLGHGLYRQWMMRHVYISASWVRFWAVGNCDLIAELLHHVAGIGNDCRIGWGKIHRTVVEEWPEDRSIVWDGRAMRPIPVRLLRAYSEVVPLACRTPYWARESIEPCAPPGAQVEFTP